MASQLLPIALLVFIGWLVLAVVLAPFVGRFVGRRMR